MADGEELGNLSGNPPVWADHEITRFLFKLSMVRSPPCARSNGKGAKLRVGIGGFTSRSCV